jgi:hypothetical protein
MIYIYINGRVKRKLIYVTIVLVRHIYVLKHTEKKKKEKEKLTGERLEHDNKRRYNESCSTPAFCLALCAF